MDRNSFCAKVKMGRPEKYFVSWLYEREDQNRQPVPRKTTGRELLAVHQVGQVATFVSVLEIAGESA